MTVDKIPVIGVLFQGTSIDIGPMCAGVILVIMIIPYISAAMYGVFEIAPTPLKESIYGVGCTTWEIVWNVVLPYTKVGMVGGVILDPGRVLGETMAVTLVIGNTNLLIDISLSSPGNGITSVLADEFAETGQDLHTTALMELGLTLFVVTFIMLAASKLFFLCLQESEGQK